MNPELGNTLEDMLRLLATPAPLEKTLSVAEVVEQYGVDFDIVEERFKALIDCGFITPASIHHVSLTPFDPAAPYRITAEGVNYLELRDRRQKERDEDRYFEYWKIAVGVLVGAIATILVQYFSRLLLD